MTDLLKCKCGGSAKLTAGTNRIKRRTKAALELGAVNSKVARREGLATGQLRRELEVAALKAEALKADVSEVHCQKCGAFAWGETDEIVVNRWNRGTEKLATLKDCCKAADDVRIDYDGMTLIKCGVCGTRHLPLDPYSGR